MFCGCIEVAQNILIKQDGSGTVELTCDIPERTISQMKTMQKLKKEMIRASCQGNEEQGLRSGLATDKVGIDKIVSRHFDLLFNPSEDQIRKELKQYEKNGISIDSMSVSVRNARRIIKINLRFKDLLKAAESDLFRAHWPFTLSKTAKGRYQFRGRIEMGGTSPVPSSPKPETMMALAPILSEFKAVLKVSVPGKILRSNALRQSKASAVWVYDFSKDQNAFHAFQNCKMDILFDGKGLDLPDIIAANSKAVE